MKHDHESTSTHDHTCVHMHMQYVQKYTLTCSTTFTRTAAATFTKPLEWKAPVQMAPPQARWLESLAIRSRSEVVILIHLGNTVIPCNTHPFLLFDPIIHTIDPINPIDPRWRSSTFWNFFDALGLWHVALHLARHIYDHSQIQCMYWLQSSFTLSLIPPFCRMSCHFILLVNRSRLLCHHWGWRSFNSLSESMFSPTSRRAAPVPWQTVIVRPSGNWLNSGWFIYGNLFKIATSNLQI